MNRHMTQIVLYGESSIPTKPEDKRIPLLIASDMMGSQVAEREPYPSTTARPLPSHHPLDHPYDRPSWYVTTPPTIAPIFVLLQELA